MADVIQVNTIDIASKAKKEYLTPSWEIEGIMLKNSIGLCPVESYRTSTEQIKSDILILPVSPSEIFFNEDSNMQSIQLVNGGELPVSLNKKLAAWSIDSLFPAKNKRYWFDMSYSNNNGGLHPYDYYCRTIYDWKLKQTPLVFMYQTWGNFYACQIKTFEFGNKDSTGNVFYKLAFQEYRETIETEQTHRNFTRKNSTYIVQEGDNILTIAKRVYGNSDYFEELLNLNGKTTPELKVGEELKI